MNRMLVGAAMCLVLVSAGCRGRKEEEARLPASVRNAKSPYMAAQAARERMLDVRRMEAERQGAFGLGSAGSMSGRWSGISQRGQTILVLKPDGTFSVDLYDRAGGKVGSDSGSFSVVKDGAGSRARGSGTRIGDWTGDMLMPGIMRVRLGSFGDAELRRL